MDGKKKESSQAGERCCEEKKCGCDRQPVRGKHAAHNDQSTSDCDKGDTDVQDCEGAHRHPRIMERPRCRCARSQWFDFGLPGYTYLSPCVVCSGHTEAIYEQGFLLIRLQAGSLCSPSLALSTSCSNACGRLVRPQPNKRSVLPGARYPTKDV